MIIRPLFGKYQKYLLTFCNTDHGKAFLIDNWGGKIDKKDKVIKVTSDSFHLLKDFVNDKPIIEATFFPGSPYLNKFAETLTYLQILEENKRMELANDIRRLGNYIYLDQTTFNPDADPETNSVDGTVGREVGTEETWATITAGAGTYVFDNIGTSGLKPEARTDNAIDKFTKLYRVCAFYWTASLTASATITAAVESYYCNTSVRDNSVWFPIAVRLVTTTHSATTSLAASDFASSNFGTTGIATDKAITTDWTVGAYTDYTLTDTSSISKTGLTRHGLRLDYDCTGSLPTTSFTYGASVHAQSQAADAGSNKPKLVVTYTLPSGTFLLLL